MVSSRDEGKAIGEFGHLRVVVEEYVGQPVPQSTQQQCDMANEPGELEGLRQTHETLLKREVRWRRACHCGDAVEKILLVYA